MDRKIYLYGSKEVDGLTVTDITPKLTLTIPNDIAYNIMTAIRVLCVWYCKGCKKERPKLPLDVLLENLTDEQMGIVKEQFSDLSEIRFEIPHFYGREFYVAL